MRAAALLVAVFTIVVGIVGVVSPDSLTTVRRLYFATPGGLLAAGAVRVAMGLVVILCAPGSRAPKTLRVLGAVMCIVLFIHGTLIADTFLPLIAGPRWVDTKRSRIAAADMKEARDTPDPAPSRNRLRML